MMMMTRSQDVSVSVPPWSRLAVGFDCLPSGSTACIVNRSDVNDDDDDDDDDDNDDDNDDNDNNGETMMRRRTIMITMIMMITIL